MKYLLLGATGTLGRATIRELLKREDTHLIRCVSRDELKLSELDREFKSDKIETAIGDIRDRSSIFDYYYGIDTVFHFAALKRIPEMEKHPVECLKTNVFGTINSAECALAHRVKHFMFSSTDKACMPINVYGACKFISEKYLLGLNSRNMTNFSVYRWGNVLASRGSVIYSFKDAIEHNLPAVITHKDMSRFWIKIEDAVQFILNTYQEPSNKIRVPDMKAAKVLDLLGAIGAALNKVPAYIVTGMRPGEKIHEDILYSPGWGSTQNSKNSAQFTDAELLEIARGMVK